MTGPFEGQAAAVGGSRAPGPATRRVLEAVVVATAAGHQVQPSPIDVSIVPEPRDLVTASAQARLTGPLLWCAAAGLVDLDDDMVDLLGSAHLEAQAWCLKVESRWWSIAGWCDDMGIRPLVVKGPAVAHLDEVDPALRGFGDLDLLVRPDDLTGLLGILGSRGAVRPYAERRRGFDRRFAKSVTVEFPDQLEIDVHRTICDGVHAVRVPIDRLHHEPESIELGGRTLHAPNRTARALHAAYHAVLGSTSPALLNVRDLIGYLGAAETTGSVGSIGAIVEEAERWGGTAVLAQAVQEALLPGVTLPAWEDWLHKTKVDPAEIAIIAAQRRIGSSFGRARLTAAREMASPLDRAAYLVAAAVPGTRHLRSRGRSRCDVLRPGAPTGLEPVVLPDLPPRESNMEERIMVVVPEVQDLEDVWGMPPAIVHAVVRRGAGAARHRWWQADRTGTTVELPAGPGWRRQLRRVSVASGELRRFDPDRVVADERSLHLVVPALLVGRRRTVARLTAGHGIGGPSSLDRRQRWCWRLIGMRHRVEGAP